MEEKQTAALPSGYEGLTFEKVWAIFQETDRRMKETDRRIGELSNRFGELAEHLVVPNIKEKFNALHYAFDKISQNIDISDAQDRYSGAEIDILLSLFQN